MNIFDKINCTNCNNFAKEKRRFVGDDNPNKNVCILAGRSIKNPIDSICFDYKPEFNSED